MRIVVHHVDYPSRTWHFEPASIVAAHQRVHARRSVRELMAIMTAFGLSPAETARLFAVRRQAVNAWLRRGVPPAHRAEVGRAAQAAAALRGFFRPERMPAIVRGPMPTLGESTVLETLATRGAEPILALVEGLRSWTPPSESAEASEALPAR